MGLSIGVLVGAHVLLDLAIVPEDHRLDDAADELLGPHAQQDALGTTPGLRSGVSPAVQGGSQHVVHPVGIQHEGGVGDVELAGCLGQGETLLEDTENGLGHGLRAPGLQGSSLAEPQLLHQVLLVGVPALLPHGLQLILVAICWKTRHADIMKRLKGNLV